MSNEEVVYGKLINFFEPLAFTYTDTEAAQASAAMSLKRIADAMTGELSAAEWGQVVAIARDFYR